MSENGVFTKREWSQNNDIKFKNAEHQQKIAEKIIGYKNNIDRWLRIIWLIQYLSEC